MARKKEAVTVAADSPAAEAKAQILQSFGYQFEGEEEADWITQATPAERVNQIPDDVIQLHVDTGFARWTNPDKE